MLAVLYKSPIQTFLTCVLVNMQISIFHAILTCDSVCIYIHLIYFFIIQQAWAISKMNNVAYYFGQAALFGFAVAVDMYDNNNFLSNNKSKTIAKDLKLPYST